VSEDMFNKEAIFLFQYSLCNKATNKIMSNLAAAIYVLKQLDFRICKHQLKAVEIYSAGWLPWSPH
jgi:hypothetical protein